jgi:hypothetical protein
MTSDDASPAAAPAPGGIARDYPGWHCWRGVSGRLYAWWRRSSPPVVVKGETWADVREAIRDTLGGLE